MMKRVFLFALTVLLAACTRDREEIHINASVRILLPHSDIPTRASDPDEDRISDYNLLVYNCFGDLEVQAYVPPRARPEGPVRHPLRLLKEVPYTILVAANLGYALPALSRDEAFRYLYYMAYPDEYSQGMPMAAVLENAILGQDEELDIRLERLMARIDLQIDRSALPAESLFKVTRVQLKGCPRCVTPFSRSRAESADALFRQGFSKENDQVDALNRGGGALSGILRLYMLENCQESRNSALCPAVVIQAEYVGPEYQTAPGEHITYSLPLGSISRNTVYPITVSIMK